MGQVIANEFTRVLCMDRSNFEALLPFNWDVEYLKSYDSDSTEIEINDPYGLPLSVYDDVFNECLDCIKGYIFKYSKQLHTICDIV